MYEQENYRRLIASGKGAVNPWLQGCEDLPMWNDPNLHAALDSLKIEKHVGYPGPVTASAAEVFDQRILAKVLHNVVNDGMSLDDALAQAQDEIHQIYERHRVKDQSHN